MTKEELIDRLESLIDGMNQDYAEDHGLDVLPVYADELRYLVEELKE